VVFVADAVGAWLVAALGEAGRKKLTSLVLGAEHERALRSAASAAVQRTAEELFPGGHDQVEQVALVINQVFALPAPDVSVDAKKSVSDALKAGVAAQLAVLDDVDHTETGSSPSDVLGVSADVLTDHLVNNLLWEILIRGSRGGALFPLASQINHDATQLRVGQLDSALHEVGGEILGSLAKLQSASSGEQQDADSSADAVLRVEQLLEGLELGDHEAAERRVNRLFLHLSRAQQRAAVEAIMHVATSSTDDVARLLACSLLEAADRLVPVLVRPEDVEDMARASDFSVRSSAAVLMWQWAETDPSRVSVSLLGRLTQPSTEDWYVHAAARAGAKQLLLRRAAARAVFDRMAASRDSDDRHYAVRDLLEVAEVEPRAVPGDLAERLASDEDESVATEAAKLIRAIRGVEEAERGKYYGQFGM
jgi:hypothetical protein